MALTIIAAPLLAQDSARSDKKQENEVELKLRIFNWATSNTVKLGGFASTKRKGKTNDYITFDVWYESAGTYHMVKANVGGLSSEIAYKGPQKMIFYKREKSATESDEYTYTKVADVTLPTGIDELFLLMYKSGQSVVFYPMNISPKELPKDKVAILNMTRHNIALQAGGTTGFLRAGSHAIFKPQTQNKNFLEIQMARMIDNKWRPIYKNNITVPDGKRCALLIFDPSRKKSGKFSILTLAL